jgi:hypothetical protein
VNPVDFGEKLMHWGDTYESAAKLGAKLKGMGFVRFLSELSSLYIYIYIWVRDWDNSSLSCQLRNDTKMSPQLKEFFFSSSLLQSMAKNSRFGPIFGN